MDIKDVKVGDRCWVAYGVPCDEHGQNGVVREISAGGNCYVQAGSVVGWFSPSETVFWAKPSAPPKPKRKVTKTYTGFIIPEHLKVLLTFNDSPTSQDRSIDMWETRRGGSSVKCTITVEVEE